MPLYGDTKRQYQLDWLKNRRDSWIQSKGGKCSKCGSTQKLEVDHIDRKLKLCNPRNIWSRNEEFRNIELDKCQVLCEDCHKLKTEAELTIQHPHGTYGRYKKGCRCRPCKDAVVTWWREYRSSKYSSMA